MMKRFRLQDNAPDTYSKRSRDFQLMCNLFDLMNNGVKFDIDTIRSLSDTETCRDSMLIYLQHKLGLFLNTDITNETLRIILKCFPYIIRKKGSREGIEEAICLFLTALHSDGSHDVEIVNRGGVDPSGNYIIKLNMEATQHRLDNIDILDQLLRYVAPTGYVLNYFVYIKPEDFWTKTANRDDINIIVINEKLSSSTKSTTGSDIPATDVYAPVLGGLGTSVITISEKETRKDTGVDPYIRKPLEGMNNG